MKQLTLLITIHSQFEAIDFFIKSIKNYSNELEVIFAFDNKINEVKKNKLELIEKNNFKYYIAEKNIGKLALVSNASQIIETPFFKIIDQDDSIDLRRINNLINQLSKIDNSSLIKHKAIKIYKNEELKIQSSDLSIIEKQIKVGKNIHLAQQTNCDTIYPTKIVKKIKNFNLTRQDFHNDVLLSNFCVGFGSKLEKVAESFYIQFHAKGQTSKFSVKRAECILELYENYMSIIEKDKNYNFKLLMWKMKISHKCFIAAFTKWYLKNDKHGIELYKKSIKIVNLLWKK